MIENGSWEYKPLFGHPYGRPLIERIVDVERRIKRRKTYFIITKMILRRYQNTERL